MNEQLRAALNKDTISMTEIMSDSTRSRCSTTSGCSTTSRCSTTSNLSSSNTVAAHLNKNNRSLDTHKWFVASIYLAEDIANQKKIVKDTENIIKKNNDKMAIVSLIMLCIIIAYLFTYDQQAFIVRMTVMLLYASSIDTNPNQLVRISAVKEEDIILYMRFTRPNIFYKNTHYIYTGTKSRLEKVFGRLNTKAEIYRIDNIKSRDEHDKLMDTPLDTFCNEQCGCEEDQEFDHYNVPENYQCSHWNLYSYDTPEEMNEDINELKKIEKDKEFQCLRNEFIYL